MITFDPTWGKMIARKAGTHFNYECDIVIARTEIDEAGLKQILGGVIFQNFTHESIAIHVSAWHPRWIDRAILWVTFDYPFNQLGVQRIFGQVPADNPRALSFDLNLGFRVIATIPKVFEGGVDDHIVCMEREDCRFLAMRKPEYELDEDHLFF